MLSYDRVASGMNSGDDCHDGRKMLENTTVNDDKATPEVDSGDSHQSGNSTKEGIHAFACPGLRCDILDLEMHTYDMASTRIPFIILGCHKSHISWTGTCMRRVVS